ncbi:MAG: enoyl-CoA hydratase/isomerase family protein [Vicinamibacterales bacterium]
MINREDRGNVAVVRMAHGKVSALDQALAERLVGELETIRKSNAGAVVLTGTGSAFSAGVDLFQVVDGGSAYVRRFLPQLDALLRALLTYPKPVVAAINGHAIAGGCIMAAACDHRVMAEGAGRIGVPELAVGVPFPTLALEIVAARVAVPALRGLIYTGRTVHVDEAVEIGLVDEAAEPEHLDDRAWEVAVQLATIPAKSFELTKKAFAGPILERVKGMAAIDAAVAEAWSAPETTEAIRTYLGKTIGKKKEH